MYNQENLIADNELYKSQQWSSTTQLSDPVIQQDKENNDVLQCFLQMMKDSKETQTLPRQSNNQQFETRFEEQILIKLELYFKKNFENLREAIIYRKKQLFLSDCKVTLNFKEIGAEFNMPQYQAHNYFDSLEQKYLDKWTKAELQEISDMIKKVYKETKNVEQTKTVVLFNIKQKQLFNKQQKQIKNLINSVLRKEQEKRQ